MMSMILSLIRPIILSGLSLAAFFLVGFFLYALIILIWSASDKAIEQPSDAIIVLTGSEGRIEKGFDLLLQNKAPRLLISGVLDQSTTLDDIVQTRSMSAKDKTSVLAHCCVDLDSIATTTEENAIESTKWIHSKGIKRFILVTSASHMPRAYLQFNRALDDTIEIIPYPVHTQTAYSLVMTSQFWLYTAREYFKYLGSWLRLEKIQE